MLVLNNLCVNSDQSHGDRGLALNRFLVEHGADASFDYASGNEAWGVIFNPACITSHQVIPASEMSGDAYWLPDPLQQIKAVKEQACNGSHMPAAIEYETDPAPSL